MAKFGGKGKKAPAQASDPASTHTGAGAAQGGSRTSSEHATRRANPADMQELEERMAALGSAEIRTDEQEAEYQELLQQRSDLLQAQAGRMLDTVQRGAAIAQPQRGAEQARSPACSPRDRSPEARSPDSDAVSGDSDEEQLDDLEGSMREPSPLRLYQLRVLRMRRLTAFRRAFPERIRTLRAAYMQAQDGRSTSLVQPLRRFMTRPSNGVPLTNTEEGLNNVIDSLTNFEPRYQALAGTVDVLTQTVQTQAAVIQDQHRLIKQLTADCQTCKERLDAQGIQQAAQHSDMQRLRDADRRQDSRWLWQKSYNVCLAQNVDATVGIIQQLVADPEEVQREVLYTPLEPFAQDRTKPLPDGPLIKLGEATGMEVDDVSASAGHQARATAGAGGGDATAKERRAGADANNNGNGGGDAAAAARGDKGADNVFNMLEKMMGEITALRQSREETPVDTQVGDAGGESGGGGKAPRMKSPKTFTGEADSYELDEALYCFESYCKGSDIPRSKWPMHCANFLGGAALTAYITYAKGLQQKHGSDAVPTWDQFQECLQLFAKPEARLRAQRELFDLRQTGTAVDYARKFKLLVARSGSKTAPEDLILMFHRGLKEPEAVDKDPLTKKWWTSLDDLVNAVVQAELSSGLRKSGGAAERNRPTFNRFKVRGGVSKLKAAFVPAQGRKRMGGKPQPGQDAKKFRGNSRVGGKGSDGGHAEACAVCQALGKASQNHRGECFHWKELKRKQPAVYAVLAKSTGRDTSKDEAN